MDILVDYVNECLNPPFKNKIERVEDNKAMYVKWRL